MPAAAPGSTRFRPIEWWKWACRWNFDPSRSVDGGWGGGHRLRGGRRRRWRDRDGGLAQHAAGLDRAQGAGPGIVHQTHAVLALVGWQPVTALGAVAHFRLGRRPGQGVLPGGLGGGTGFSQAGLQIDAGCVVAVRYILLVLVLRLGVGRLD